MTTNKKLTALIVLLSLTSVLGISGAVYQYTSATKYKSAINHSYSRSLTELADSVSEIEFSLEKGLLISSPAQMVRLSNEINRHSNTAIANLGQLPLTGTELDNTEKFLSQVGAFSNALAMKVSRGENLTEEDYTSLKSLADYSAKLSKNFKEMESSLLDGKLTVEQLKYTAKNKSNKFLGDIISATEEEFVNYPSLIYDGPFSSHIDTIEYFL